jgi:CubicO group peptidase (beta-lactamase class C family)
VQDLARAVLNARQVVPGVRHLHFYRGESFMKKSLILLLIVFLPLAVFAQRTPVNSFTHADFARVDSIFQEFNRKDSPGCAAAVIDNGKVIYKKGYGMANLEHNIPISPHTVFDVASVSKQFTAFAIALLSKRGRLSLDDDVRKYVPELPEFERPVTIRHLVHHTSGLRDYGALLIMTGWRLDHPLNTADFIDVVSKQKSLNFAPGEKFMYSNTNYALLGMIVERVSGRAFGDFMKTEVFTPLGMNNTIVRSDPLTIVPNRASNYTPRKDGGYKLNYVWGFSKVMGPGSVHTTLEDLAKWDANFYDERIGGAGIRNLLYSSAKLNSGQRSDSAFGLFTYTYRGLSTVSHIGLGGGSFVLTRFPGQKFSVAVLCNRYYTHTDASLMAERVADIFLADRFEEKKAAQTAALPVAAKESPTENELAHYAGVFWMEGSSNRITFAVNSGKLTAQNNSEKVFPLIYVSKGRFFSEGEGLLYSFGETDTEVMPLEITVPGTTESYKASRQPRANLQPDQLKGYVGTYRNNEIDISWSIELIDGKLRVRREKFADAVLEPSYRDGFYFSYSDDTGKTTYLLNFQRSKDEMSDHFTVDSGRLSRIVFKRVKQ